MLILTQNIFQVEESIAGKPADEEEMTEASESPQEQIKLYYSN